MNPKNLPSCHASTPNTQHLARVVTAESRHLLVHLPPVVTMATTARKVCYPCNRCLEGACLDPFHSCIVMPESGESIFKGFQFKF